MLQALAQAIAPAAVHGVQLVMRQLLSPIVAMLPGQRSAHKRDTDSADAAEWNERSWGTARA
jgi:hypothetical protein